MSIGDHTVSDSSPPLGETKAVAIWRWGFFCARKSPIPDNVYYGEMCSGFMCSGRSKSSTVLTGLKVLRGTSTKTVFQ